MKKLLMLPLFLVLTLGLTTGCEQQDTGVGGAMEETGENIQDQT